MSEDRLQQECFLWFNNEYPKLRGLLFHVPNGGHRNAREGAKFKTMGVIKGVSDLIFLYRGMSWLLELKTEIGFQSQNQLDWEDKVKEQGFEYYVIRSVKEFQVIIEAIIN